MPARREATAFLPFLRRFRLLVAAIAFAATASGAFAAQPGYRIFISIDMEGISGAVTSNQISATGIDYQQSRRIMTEELLAAIAGAREAGATEFVVADAHGQAQNILIDELPADVRLVRGTARPLSMMEGIQNGRFDGVFFIGYHAGASNIRGVRAHSFVSARISEVRLNGNPAAEGHVNSAIAAQFGTPVLLVTGDDATIEELRSAAPGAETVAVKRAISFHAAEILPPAEARRRIREAAARAVRRIRTFSPPTPLSPVTMDLTFHFYQPAELLAWLPNVERTGGRSIRFQAPDMAAATRFLNFITNYTIELEP